LSGYGKWKRKKNVKNTWQLKIIGCFFLGGGGNFHISEPSNIYVLAVFQWLTSFNCKEMNGQGAR
jgi:hypothetical protein